MKFMYNGYIFSFWQDKIIVWDSEGDKYCLRLTDRKSDPFEIHLIEKRNYAEDYPQSVYEKEMKKEYES